MIYLSYIKSTGSQWIDTGYIANANSKFELDAFINTSGQPTYAAPFGSYVNGSSGIYFMTHIGSSPNLTLAWGGADRRSNVYNVTGQRILAVYSGGAAHVEDANGTTICDYSVTAGSSFPGFSMRLFGISGLSTSHTCAMKLYRFRIYEGDTLVRDFRPALDDNSVPGLYDEVAHQFFYNAGTGNFEYPYFYDKSSFLAGLAVGRLLWKPPNVPHNKDTGLGWNAEPAYLLYDADTYLGSNIGWGRNYYKGYDGWAVCAWVDGAYQNWHGPYLISTSRVFAGINDPISGRIPADLGPVNYLGLDWYYTPGAHVKDRNFTTPLKVITGNYESWDALTVAILQAANVSVY